MITFPTNGGGRTVSTTGAKSIVAASIPCTRIDIQALATNTKNVAVGSAGANATPGSENGIQLQPGEIYNIDFPVDALSIFLNPLVSGEGVSYTYWQGQTV
jgi:hypothetical protein